MTGTEGRARGGADRCRSPSRSADPQLTPLWLDRFKPWLIAAGVLLVVAYGPQLVDQISNMKLNAPGTDFTPW